MLTSPFRWKTAFSAPMAATIAKADYGPSSAPSSRAAPASRDEMSARTAGFLRARADVATKVARITPSTNAATRPPAKVAAAVLLAMPTASRVELPLMKETKKPPSLMKPRPSTYPANPARQAASTRNASGIVSSLHPSLALPETWPISGTTLKPGSAGNQLPVATAFWTDAVIPAGVRRVDMQPDRPLDMVRSRPHAWPEKRFRR